MSKIVLTSYINFSFNITHKSLTTFRLLILTFLFHSLLIFTLPTNKTFIILEFEAKQDATIAMFLNRFYNIFIVVITCKKFII